MTEREASLREFLEKLESVHHSAAGADLRKRGYAYGSVASYLLANGRPMPKGNGWSPEEQALLKKLRARQQVRKGQCWANCQRLLTKAFVKGLCKESAPVVQYVEGYGLSVIPADHAWLLVNGKVWDPTWDLIGELAEFPLTYFGAVLPAETVLKAAADRRCFTSVLDDWQGKWPLLKEKE